MDTEATQTKTVPESKSGIKRTSINVPENLWDEVRVAAIRRKMTATDAVEEALRLWVAGMDERISAA